MKTIGLIGGMSWQSSKFYYRYLNELVAERLGELHSAKIIMSSVNFNEINILFAEEDWVGIGQKMANEATKLESAGADCIILATNTIHLVSEQIVNAITIPFLHIADAVGMAIKKKQLKKVALLGTRFTMEKEFYTAYLSAHYDLEVLLPNTSEREYLQQLIFDELVKGSFTNEGKDKCVTIIERLHAQGAEGVILGCTELPILIPDGVSPIPTFDTTMIHSKMAVDFALK